MQSDPLLTRNPDLIAAEMDGELVMMDMESGTYFALNAVGSHIWDALQTPQHQSALVQDVLSTFDTSSASDVAGDVKTFLGTLMDKGLVHRSDG